MTDVIRMADEQLAQARSDPRGRSTRQILHDGPLRQTVIALSDGAVLDEHDGTPAGGLHVLRGRVRLTAGGDSRDLDAGALESVPHERHGLEALDDSVVLLTAVSDR